MNTRCQLAAVTEQIARELTPVEKIARRWGKIRKRAGQILRKMVSPSAVAGKAKRVLHLPQAGGGAGGGGGGGMGSPYPTVDEAEVEVGKHPIKVPPLGLQPGEMVRVKSYAEILKTLDANRCYEGCALMPIMREFCGRTYTVRKRIDHFFDERNRKLLKAKNMVILNEVHCHSEPDNYGDWAGCDRSCYLFWKEAWLERVQS